MKPSIQQKTSQSLVLSKQMQQSLRILQMSTAELTEYLNYEIEANPFLNKVESDSEKAFITTSTNDYSKTTNAYNNDGSNIYDIQDDQDVTLTKFLTKQIHIEFICKKEKEIALYITDQLDEAGYLKKDVKILASAKKSSLKLVTSILNRLKKFEPTGVYASTLEECLKLQLEEQGLYNEKYRIIIHNLQKIAQNQLHKVCKENKIDLSEARLLMSHISTLNPKPGNKFSTSSPTQFLIPDAFIMDSKDNKAFLNVEHNNNLNFDSNFFEKSFKLIKTKEEKAFFNEKKKHANWLLKSVNLRNQTLQKVVSYLAQEQYECWVKGINFLKPMQYKEVAKNLQVNESTICRIANKVISTPIGVFEIKHFFTNALNTNYSEDQVSSLSVKESLRKIVLNETENKVLSDDDIMSEMVKLGISISRRTITKYRKQLKIPSSHIRKRYFRKT